MKLYAKMNWVSPSRKALIGHELVHPDDAGSLEIRVDAWDRRSAAGWPCMPTMCIRKNVPLKKMKVRKKWIFPSLSFIIRPNIFGNQK